MSIFNSDEIKKQKFICHSYQPTKKIKSNKGSYTSLGFDARSIASENIRRTSLAKLSALPLEAPITKVTYHSHKPILCNHSFIHAENNSRIFRSLKVVSILSQVQESCSPDEARLLDKVMEFLKREGLYSPQVKDMRTDDPVATDLIGALLTVNSLASSKQINKIISCEQSIPDSVRFKSKWRFRTIFSKDHRTLWHQDEARMTQWFGPQIVKALFCYRWKAKEILLWATYFRLA